MSIYLYAPKSPKYAPKYATKIYQKMLNYGPKYTKFAEICTNMHEMVEICKNMH